MAPPSYHHGNLREALIEGGVELAREGGPDAVVLREASRRIGVSHNAAYRHFADRDALLADVRERCMSELARLMDRRIGEVPGRAGVRAERARLRASGEAYLEFALTETGWFRAAFSPSHHAAPPPAGGAAGDGEHGPFELLSERLDAFEAAGGFPPARRPLAEYAAWSAVHGLATLLTDGPLRDVPASERRRLVGRVLDNVERGL